MKLCILCLDDNLQTLRQPLHSILGPMLSEGSIPELSGGISEPFKIDGFGEKLLEIEITSNSQNDPEKVVREIEQDFHARTFDVVLVDDDWGKFGNTAGQSQLLPCVISAVSGVCPELPVFVLFTQHWDQTDRVKMFCDLMDRYPEEQRRVTGLHKNDTSGLMLLIQRIVTEKRIAEDRQRLAEENKRLRQSLDNEELLRNTFGLPSPEKLPSGPPVDYICGESLQMRAVYWQIEVESRSNDSIYIFGETGVGKELVARAIHDLGRGKHSGPFIDINCANLDSHRLYGDLFGVKKKYPGYQNDVRLVGKIEEAENGTLFLDEVGELPQKIQAAFLRFLDTDEYTPLGESKKRANVRVIAATNRDLNEAMNNGEFRADLYYRLNAERPIHVPALRERTNDLPALVRFFLDHKDSEASEEHRNTFFSVIIDAIQKTLYSFPGNVRELERIVKDMVKYEVISAAELVTEFEKRKSVRAGYNPTGEIRHASRGVTSGHWCIGDFEFEGKVAQSHKDYYILKYFLERPNVLISAEEVIAYLDKGRELAEVRKTHKWKPYIKKHTFSAAVTRLRKKINDGSLIPRSSVRVMPKGSYGVHIVRDTPGKNK